MYTNLGPKIPNPDELSRLIVEDYFTPLPCPEEVVFFMTALDSTPATAKTVSLHTSRDPVLSKVCKWIIHGWLYNECQDF